MITQHWPTDPLTIVHKDDDESYPRWGGPEGIRRAHRLGATAIDIDILLARRGLPVMTHWAKPRRHRFTGPIDRDARIQDLIYPEIRRLVCTAKDAKGYRIHKLETGLEIAAQLGMVLCLEAKPDKRFADPETWLRIRRMAERHRARIVAMCIEDATGRAGLVLPAAHAANVPTMALPRRHVPLELAPYLDAVKSTRSDWVGHLPPEIRQVGNHARAATIHGAGCRPSTIAEANRLVANARAKAAT